MRFTVLMVSLALATTAVADDKRKPPKITKEVDKATPMLMSTGGSTDDATQVKAPRDAASGLATGKRTHAPPTSCTDGVDNDCDGAASAAPANHNTTRSNRTLRATPPSSGGSTGATRGVGYNSSRSNNTNGEADGGGNSGGGTRAQDYNSSRSNTDGVRLDDDSDGDSLEEVRCSMRSDDCVSTGDGNDLVLRKRPGR